MSIRFDDGHKTLKLSARDLLFEGAPAGDLRLEVVQRSSTRARAGQRAHQWHQTAQHQTNKEYQAEVSFKRSVLIDGWTCTIAGRIDGLFEEGGQQVVEEIKSTSLDASRLYPTTISDWPNYSAQLQVYIWALTTSGKAHPIGRLVLISLSDGSQHVLGLNADISEIEALIVRRLEQMVLARQRKIAWLAARKTFTVPTPHQRWRAGQSEVFEGVQWGLQDARRVLVQAPTGLGKTDAALYGALKFAYQNDKQIFWATARTTQQAVAIKAIERFAQQGLPVRAVVLQSKTKACLKEEVNCSPDTCAFAKGYHDTLHETDLLYKHKDQVHTPSTVRALGQTNEVCPYQLALDFSSHVDVVIGDVNYAFDPSVQLKRHFSTGASDWIVIVDEAHQLVERARGWGSPVVAAATAAAASRALFEAGSKWAAFSQLADDIAYEVRSKAQSAVQQGKEAVYDLDVEQLRLWAKQVDDLSIDYAIAKANQSPFETTDSDLYLQMARQVLRYQGAAEVAGEETRAVASRERGRETLGLLCLDPSKWLGEQIAKLGGFVALSATLSPTEFFQNMFGLPPEEVSVVTVGSPFDEQRRSVLVYSRVSTAYADRHSHRRATADAISRCAAAVKGNIGLYFPSFEMAKDLNELLYIPGRTLIEQRPQMSDAEREAMLSRLDTEDNLILSAVLGGIFAEGIDLAPGCLSAIFIVGPAFPPIGLERSLLREYYDKKYEAGFLYASLIPGLTRVVQAAGRLIRRKEDRGVVLLLGRRFRWRTIAALLPEDWNTTRDDVPWQTIQSFFAAAKDDDAHQL